MCSEQEITRGFPELVEGIEEIDDIEEVEGIDEIVPPEDAELFLTPEEIALLSVNVEKHNVINKQIENDNLRKTILTLNERIISLEKKLVEKDKENQKLREKNTEREYKELKEATKKMHNNIASKYGIEGKEWGYNPDSGAIVINE